MKFESLLPARKSKAKTPVQPPSLPGAPVARLRSSGAGRDFPASLFAAFELTVRAGECLVLLGPSGVGKSSLLKLLTGELASTPSLSLTWLPERPKALAYMAQSDVLLPWRTVLANVSLGALMRGKRQETERAAACLTQVGLEERWHRAYPQQLSGGMRQRVALARCLYEQADLVLMDEPLSAVDAALRIELQGLLANRLAHKTRVLVTHDPFEAARLGQVIVVLGGAPAGVCLQINDERKGPRAFDDPIVRSNTERLTRCLLDQPWRRLSAGTIPDPTTVGGPRMASSTASEEETRA